MPKDEEKGNTNIEIRDNQSITKSKSVTNSTALIIGLVAMFLIALVAVVVVLVKFLPQQNGPEKIEFTPRAGAVIEGKNIFPDRSDDEFEDFSFTLNEDISTVTASFLGTSALRTRIEFVGSFEFLGNTYRVNAIGKSRGGSGFVESVGIADGIERIEAGAFSGFSALQKITIPESVKELGRAAFEDCGKLSSVTFLGEVQPNENIFRGCNNLTGIEIPNIENGFLGQYFGAPSDENQNDYLPASLREVVVAGGKEIRYSAFEGCDRLTKITLPSGLEKINALCFQECASLSEINLPSSLTSIGAFAFFKCTSLEKIEIPAGVTALEEYVFKECTNLKSVTLPSELKIIGENAFNECVSLQSISLPLKLEELGSYSFEKCENLRSVSLYASLTAIGSFVFNDCKNLSSVTMSSENVASFGSNLLEGTAYYENKENWTDGVLYLGKYLLDAEYSADGAYKVREGTLGIAESGLSHTDYESVEIPASVKYIGEGAFSGCGKLVSLTVAQGNSAYYAQDNCLIERGSRTLIAGCQSSVIPQGVTSIGNFAFSWIPLTKIEIPDSVTSVGDWAFENCNKMTEVKLSEGLQTLGFRAFAMCTGLERILLPASVTAIDYYAFSGCENLKSVTFEDSAHDWKVSIFLESNRLSREELSDPSVLAKLLTDTYAAYRWSRID